MKAFARVVKAVLVPTRLDCWLILVVAYVAYFEAMSSYAAPKPAVTTAITVMYCLIVFCNAITGLA